MFSLLPPNPDSLRPEARAQVPATSTQFHNRMLPSHGSNWIDSLSRDLSLLKFHNLPSHSAQVLSFTEVLLEFTWE